MPGRSKELNVLAHGGEIVVTEPKHDFCAVYVKSVNSPLLVLKLRAPTTDVELMVRALRQLTTRRANWAGLSEASASVGVP